MRKLMLLFYMVVAFPAILQAQTVSNINFFLLPFTYTDSKTDSITEKATLLFGRELRKEINKKHYLKYHLINEIIDFTPKGYKDDIRIGRKLEQIKSLLQDASSPKPEINKKGVLVLIDGVMELNQEGKYELKINYLRFNTEEFSYSIGEFPNLINAPIIIDPQKQNLIAGAMNGYFMSFPVPEMSLDIEHSPDKTWKKPKQESITETIQSANGSKHVSYQIKEIYLSDERDCRYYIQSKLPLINATHTYAKWLSDYSSLFGEGSLESSSSNSDAYGEFYMNTDEVIKVLDLQEGWYESSIGNNYICVINKIDRQIIYSMSLFGGTAYTTYQERYREFKLCNKDSYKETIDKYGRNTYAILPKWIEKKGSDFKELKNKALDKIAETMTLDCGLSLPADWKTRNIAGKIAWIKNANEAFRKCKDNKFLD